LRWGGQITALFGQVSEAEDREVARITFPASTKVKDRRKSVREVADVK
jgi:hypothetical protein